jgi:hypothetical protein
MVVVVMLLEFGLAMKFNGKLDAHTPQLLRLLARAMVTAVGTAVALKCGIRGCQVTRSAHMVCGIFGVLCLCHTQEQRGQQYV